MVRQAVLRLSTASKYRPTGQGLRSAALPPSIRKKGYIMTILRLLWSHRKWTPLMVYTILAVFLWTKRITLIYTHLPVQISPILYDLLSVSLILLGFVGVLQEVRCPFITKAKVYLAFQQAGVMNDMGQYPVLISVAKDHTRKRGRRYTKKIWEFLRKSLRTISTVSSEN